jgi:hypothetical protein
MQQLGTTSIQLLWMLLKTSLWSIDNLHRKMKTISNAAVGTTSIQLLWMLLNTPFWSIDNLQLSAGLQMQEQIHSLKKQWGLFLTF